MDFSLGSPSAAPEAPPARRKPSAGTMDLSFAPVTGGGDITQLHPEGKGDTVGADWFNEVSAWWIRHRFYPDEAARLQQQGDVTLRLRVAQSGHVEMLELDDGSGSPWLDMGAEAVFRNANLPPLPGDVRDPNITVDFTIHYEILR
jgi:periplasmic protein TonB